MQNQASKTRWKTFCKLAIPAGVLLSATSTQAASLSLTRGTPNTLTGSLGTVDITYVDDDGSLSGALTMTGFQTFSPIPSSRIQYDLLNRAGNSSIFSFTVPIGPGVDVIGAGDPTGFYQSDGTNQTYWGGLANTTLFDNGYGTYDYNLANGGEWVIDYQPDSVTWRQIGNGFFPDTATGRTNHGFNPTFRLYFDPSVVFGLVTATVEGQDSTGGIVSASGRVLSGVSAVPVPAAVWLFGSGLLGLIGLARKAD